MSEIRCVASPHARSGRGRCGTIGARCCGGSTSRPRVCSASTRATGENRAWPMPERIGCVALRENGGLIGAFRTGFKWIDPDTGAVTPILDPEPDRPGNRFNDGKCDRRGRLFAGTMDNEEIACTGRCTASIPICRCTPGDRRASIQRARLEPRRPRHVLHRHPASRDLGLRLRSGDRRDRASARLRRGAQGRAGGPDGLCVDVEGFVWSAHWGGWRVTRYDPGGRIERVIEMPAAQITCPAFEGPGWVCFTSARPPSP